MKNSTVNPKILYEDAALIAINKPSGLLSIPDREGKEISLKQILQSASEIYTVHRLDKGTSGVIVFAKDQTTHKQLSQLFEARETEKIYYGLLQGSVSPPAGKIDVPIMQHSGGNKMIISEQGKPSLTEYELIEDFKRFSWVKFHILTGRTHQIRLHAKHLGYPVLCDDLYGDGAPLFLSQLKRNYHLSKKEETETPILARLALHAASLKFNLDKEYFFEAPLPKDLKAVLQQLRKMKK